MTAPTITAAGPTLDKYDRQLRLWGAAGQQALATTLVVLIGTSAAGTETLKNLVLPGVGSVLVIDDEKEQGMTTSANEEFNSCTSNFFLVDQSQDIATKPPRAQRAMELLRELNPDVHGDFQQVDDLQTADYATLFRQASESSDSPRTTSTKLLVVASDLPPPILDAVASACHAQSIPLIHVVSYGLIGAVRLQVPVLPLMNPKPRDAPPDLRLMRPFAALQQLADSIAWDALENRQHGHVPYPLILLTCSAQWKAEHNGKLPSNFSEKQEFSEFVKSKSRNYDNELNFQEAVKNCYLAYAERELDIEQLVELQQKAAASNEFLCQKFSVLVQALQMFLDKHKRPPLNGTIPDMTASTELYVSLQRVYKDQADQDLSELKGFLVHALASFPAAATVTDEELSIFSQNIYNLDLLQMRTVAEEYTSIVPDDITEDLSMATMEGDELPDQLPLLWYLGLSACRMFYQQQGRYPGVVSPNDDDTWQQDIAPLQDCLVAVVRRYKLQDNDLIKGTLLSRGDDGKNKYAAELARYGNAEYHAIASVVGGVASQEAVKIITGQYVPLNHTYVYNGIASTGGVYRF